MDRKIGVIHYHFSRPDLAWFLEWAAAHGCGYVEIERPDIWNGQEEPEKTVEKVRGLLAANRLSVSQVTARNDFLQKTREAWQAQVTLIEKMCKLVKLLGYNQLRIDGGWPKEGVAENTHKELIISGIKAAVEIAERENVFLALDNHGQVTNNYLFQLEIFRTIGSKFLGANVDTMNYRWYGYQVGELPAIFEAIAPYALHTHMKDGVGSLQDYQGKALGKGEVPLTSAVSALKKAGYRGVWCAECEDPANDSAYAECVDWLGKNV